jgi:hypothetical protein
MTQQTMNRSDAWISVQLGVLCLAASLRLVPVGSMGEVKESNQANDENAQIYDKHEPYS